MGQQGTSREAKSFLSDDNQRCSVSTGMLSTGFIQIQTWQKCRKTLLTAGMLSESCNAYAHDKHRKNCNVRRGEQQGITHTTKPPLIGGLGGRQQHQNAFGLGGRGGKKTRKQVCVKTMFMHTHQAMATP